MISVPLKRLARDALVPLERLGGEIKPGKQADAHQDVGAAPIGGAQHGLDGILRADRHPAGVHRRRVERPPVVRFARQGMAADVPRGIEQILDDDAPDAGVRHVLDVPLKVRVRHLREAVAEIPRLLRAPVLDGDPAAVEQAGAGRVGAHDLVGHSLFLPGLAAAQEGKPQLELAGEAPEAAPEGDGLPRRQRLQEDGEGFPVPQDLEPHRLRIVGIRPDFRIGVR